MRILIFSTDDFLPPAGGAELAVGEITKRLPHIQFDLICARLRPESARYEERRNIRIFRLGVGIPKLDGLFLALLGSRKALALHRAHPYDMVWGVLASYGGFAAARFKRAAGVPFLLTLQEGKNLRSIETKAIFFKRQFRNIFRTADGLQSISKMLDAWGKKTGFVGIARIIPNGVDMPVFSAPSAVVRAGSIRKSLPFSSDATVLITVSRLVPKNGVGDIIAALPLLPSNICLVICGDGPLRKKLQRQTRLLGVESRVHFAGFIQHDDIASFLKAGDVFIRPSLSEGLGSAFLEAMAAGIVVIGTPVGGITDFLIDGQNGFYCQPNNPASIAKAVERVLGLSYEEKQQILNRALVMVEQKYTWEMIGQKMGDFFQALCKTP